MKPFQFKEFEVYQDKTAMKIGTDAVILGAWSSVEHFPDTILDIGSGTGVLGLMLAQRCDALTIDAIEVEDNAYEQTVENFERSDWADRLFCYHTSFLDFTEEMIAEDEKYDLIISNPPFYTDTFQTENEARNKARFTSSLTFEELLKGVSELITDQGVFCTIIPFKEEEDFIKLAKSYNLLLSKICRVKGNATSEIKRSLLSFSFQDKPVIEEELIIEKERHQYTDAYINLTKEFYLKM